MSNADGTLAEGPYTYDTFGNGPSLTGTPYKYAGMRLDPETGLYYDRARYYSAMIGRFLQIDPAGSKSDLNLYAYVFNDPTDKRRKRNRRGAEYFKYAAAPEVHLPSPCCMLPVRFRG